MKGDALLAPAPSLPLCCRYSYEKYGFAESYMKMGLMVFCTTFISSFLLRGNKSSSEGLLSQPSAL